MDVSIQNKRDSKVGSVCEAVTLISITLMLISLHLNSSGAKGAGWWIFFAIVSVIGLFGCIVASYRQITKTATIEGTAQFWVTSQLVETLKTKEWFPDVIYGLDGLVKRKGDFPVKDEEQFEKLLKETLGWERAQEVKELVMRYAQVRNAT